MILKRERSVRKTKRNAKLLTSKINSSTKFLRSVLSFCLLAQLFFLKKILFIYFQRQGKGGEREGEKHQCMVASPASPTGDLACNPGMCPNWESNRQPFGSQAGTQSTELHQLGQLSYFLKIHIGGGQKVLAHINLQKFVAC